MKFLPVFSDDLATLVFFIVFAYLLGSIPFGIIWAKVFNLGSLRDIGSGNIGATNVLRTGNKLAAFLTLFCDGGKGFVAVLFAELLSEEFTVQAVCLFVFIGHCFPIWLKFKGGKGVATYVGILFAINIYFGIVFTISWFVTFFISKFSSLSSLVGAASIPIYLLILSQFNQAIFFAIMFILIFFTHRENIKRLKNKEETKTKIY